MGSEQTIPLVLTLAATSASLSSVGGKGVSLARLAAAGLPVPPGFHITTSAYQRFVAENGLQEQILAAVSNVAPDRPATLDVAAKTIAELFAQSVIPDDIVAAIQRAYHDLSIESKEGAFTGAEDDLPVAVRSSATAEDLPEMSFAGQQETYLNMHGTAMVLAAVKRCWASLWTARAIGYRALHAIAPADVSLAVVVQSLVPADAAGILFTANPLTGARDQMMINATWGLGEAIVSGQVTPDTFVVDRTTGAIVEQQINQKDVMTVRTHDGTREEAVPEERRQRAVLDPSQVAALVRIGDQIEALYTQPMDIEWAAYGGNIFVVQARPITALPEPISAATQLASADPWQVPNSKGSYMRASVLELLPDPLTPLFATVGFPAWSRALDRFMRSMGSQAFPENMLTIINGYGYYDMSFTPAQKLKVGLELPRLFLGMPRLLRSSKTRWLAQRTSYAALVERWQAYDVSTTPASDLLTGICAIADEAAVYYVSVQSGILPGAYISELIFTQAYNRLLKPRNASPALTFLLGFDSAPIQAEKSLYDLAQWVCTQPELATELAAMSNEQFLTAYHAQTVQGKTATAEVAASMRQETVAGETDTVQTGANWPVFWQRLQLHLHRFGHAIYDLDFAKPVLADDPSSLLETLKFFLSEQATNPYERQARAAAARDEAMQVVLAQLRGQRRKLFRKYVERAQRFAPLREDALADVGLGWPVLRQFAHEIGRRLVAHGSLAQPDDIYYLELADLRLAIAALDADRVPEDAHEIVAERRAFWERERAMTPPVALPLKTGARFMGIDFSSMMPARTDQARNDLLKGIAASPGRITGVARVIHGPDEFAQMQQGDILVARITTPAWTPLFALAGAVVTDIGGPLSHSSIVAREYHIPAVLGTGSATEHFSSGQQIIVDGDAGTVAIVR